MNATLHAIDGISPTALDDARASDARAERGDLRGPLDGVPVFAKAIYDDDIVNQLRKRVVMLGPPNGGSEVADLLKNVAPYRAFYGPAGQQLGTSGGYHTARGQK